MMTIEKGDFIKLSFTAKIDEGRVFDTTEEDVARENKIYNEKGKYGGDVIIVGAGHTVAGLDEDLIGKDVGYRGTLTLPPEKAYGNRNPELIETVQISLLKNRPQVGMIVEIGGRQGTVIRVIGRQAQVDFNRYLAGATVTYDYEIKEKIDDPEGKIKGLLNLYVGIKLPVQINEGTALIELMPGLTYDQNWLNVKIKFAKELIANTNIKNIIFLERYNTEVLEPKKPSQ